ncbi:MAG: lysylphosphatidylglycerol synthase transmembrane domain-containing protein [bacterium]
MKKKRLLNWKNLLAFAISFSCLFFFLKDIEFEEVYFALKQVDYRWVPLMVLAIWFSIVFRAFRWQILLRRIKDISVIRLYHMWAIGLMINCVLPARMGDVIKAWILGQKEQIAITAPLATVVVERLYDLCTVVLILSFVLATFTFPAGQTYNWKGVDYPIGLLLRKIGISFFMIALFVIAVLGILVYFPAQGRKKILRIFPGAMRERLEDLLASFILGLDIFRRPIAAILAGLWSLGVWSSIMFCVYFLFRGFDLPIGILGSFLLMSALGLCVALPQAPGFIGVFHLATEIVLVKCFAIDLAVAQAFAISLWFIQIMPQIAIGFISLAIEGVSFEKIRERSQEA